MGSGFYLGLYLGLLVGAVGGLIVGLIVMQMGFIGDARQWSKWSKPTLKQEDPDDWWKRGESAPWEKEDD